MHTLNIPEMYLYKWYEIKDFISTIVSCVQAKILSLLDCDKQYKLMSTMFVQNLLCLSYANHKYI